MNPHPVAARIAWWSWHTLCRRNLVPRSQEAIARNRVPFARAGRGSVVIRSTSASQRRRQKK
jgi:hypothetical protein